MTTLRAASKPRLGATTAALLACLATVLATAAVVTEGSVITRPVAGLVVVVLGLSLCFVDLAWLPAIALAGFALVPVTYLSLPTQHGTLSPAIAIGALFTLRFARRGKSLHWSAVAVPVWCLTLWVIIATLLSQHPMTSAAWSVNFVLLVTVPALTLAQWAPAQQRVERTWIALGGVLGLYALVEFGLGRNPLLGNLYASGATPLQEASGYRVTTTLGHPLVNGTFFAVAAILGASHVVRGQRGWTLAATGFAVVGVLASQSRGAALAFLVGLGVLFGAPLLRLDSRLRLRTITLGISVLVATAAVGYAAVSHRSAADTAGSTSVRLATYQGASDLIHQYFPWGGGPGLADELKRSLTSGDQQRGVESSALQLLISLGLPGGILAVLTIMAAGLSAIRRRAGAAAALTAYVVAAATFNLLETNRPALLMWGLLLGLCARVPATEARSVY